MAKYWVGGSGNTSDTTHWATSSGGAGSTGVPTSSDDVIFDSLSNSTAYTVTVDSAMSCADFTMAGPLVGAVTWAGSSALNIYGSMSLSGTAGITRTYTGTITFASTATGKTIATNNVNLGATIIFDGVGGGWTMSDNFTSDAGSTGITLTNGALDFNGKTITIGGAFSSSNSNTRTLTLGASTINAANGWNIANTTGLTFNANTSSISITNGGSVFFQGGGLTYNNLTTGSTTTVTGTNTFANLTIGVLANTVGHGVSFSNNQTVTGTFTSTGNSTINRNFVKSSTVLTPVTITAGTVSISNTDFQDITGAGAGSWTGTSIGDCGGNSGITVTTAVDQHWINASSGNWSIAANWTSRVPLPQDNVFMDMAFGTSQTVTGNMPRSGRNIDWTGATWTTALTYTPTVAQSYYGNLTLISGLTYTGASVVLTLEGRANATIDSKGVTIDQPVTMQYYSNTLTMGGNLTIGSTRTLTLTTGTLTVSASNYVLSTGLLSVGAAATFTQGTETDLLTGTGSVLTWTGTINVNTSTFKITNSSNSAVTFAGGGKTFNNVWFSRGASTGTNTITGANIFNDFKDDGSAAHTNTFPASTIQKFTTFSVSGTAGNLISLSSATAGTRTIFICTSGTISRNYLSLTDTLVGGGATWNGGANTTFVSNNEGWADQPTTPTRYWVPGGDGNWNNTNNWSATSGGASGASIPTGDMNVFFDASSGSGTSTVNAATRVRNLDFTGFTGTLSGSSALNVYGNMTLVATMTNSYTGVVTYGLSFLSKNITCGGIYFGGPTIFGVSLSSAYIVDTWALSDAFLSTSSVAQNCGTFNANNFNYTSTTFTSSNSNLRTITMGSGTWNLTSTLTTTVWNIGTPTNLTLNANTSTIKINGSTANIRTFSGGGLTYNNIWFSNATSNGQLSVVGSNTFNNFKCDTPPQTIKFTAGTTTTVSSWTVSGTAGNLMTIGSLTAATHTLTKTGGGTIQSDYLSLSYSTATPATTWYAGTNSTDGGNNSGWSFTSLVSAANASFLFLMAK